MTTDPQGEIIDIVDENNRVTGSTTRGEIHRLGLRHRACHIFVYDRSGRVLVQQRSLTKDNSPGLWDSAAAGHVDTGESYTQCAVRELYEELGLSVQSEHLVEEFLLPASAITGMEFAQVYSVVSGDQVQPDPVEVARTRWCTSGELSDWMSDSPDDFTAVCRLIWQRLVTAETDNPAAAARKPG